ncbi:hypothetical protein AGOR_G00238260 [Albula goreensis]|uniref:Uncharacterized protein n=1 Tax=Albula goreensis TaxID=1534307 RepID=A0A8T3CFG3_9TELE|nr:hypothetical protein AGOR_G00238260 [Albula goreensis]
MFLPIKASVPPVMAFHLGSLGFLTPFKFESYKTEVAKVFEESTLFVLHDRKATATVTGPLPQMQIEEKTIHSNQRSSVAILEQGQVLVWYPDGSFVSSRREQKAMKPKIKQHLRR